ncbi:MAG: peptidoglycan DD-metalloendopeptidase family protein [Bacteroidota bacterium]|nr:peptidoglycan DD-metalloendopeptidase family protein [Bacteroidota bacterium]
MHKIIIILFLIFSNFIFAQKNKQKQLEDEKIKIQKQIANFKELLKSEQNKEKPILEKLDEQRTKIRLTEKLIRTTREQEKLLSQEINDNEQKINELTKEIETLREDYANMIVKSYNMRSTQSRLMFILSSDNFLQAYKRIQYMKQYADFRREQGEELKKKTEILTLKNQELAVKKKEKEAILKDQRKELANLEQETKVQDDLIAIINKNKKKFLSDISEKQKEADKIDKQIEKLKREAIAEANKKKAKSEGRKVSNKEISSTKYELSPEGKIIADNFKANKGKLPWPVEKGAITSRYGNQPHPIEKHLIVNNTGIVFSTPQGAEARAVFQGEVTQIMMVTPVNMHVWVQHGDYVTIYGNLDKVYVKKGDKVELKQKLGKIHTYSNGTTSMKFTVTQNINTLNPEQWLENM